MKPYKLIAAAVVAVSALTLGLTAASLDVAFEVTPAEALELRPEAIEATVFACAIEAQEVDAGIGLELKLDVGPAERPVGLVGVAVPIREAFAWEASPFQRPLNSSQAPPTFVALAS